MKYHKHIIKKVYVPLGEENARKNCYFEIYFKGQYINSALTLSNAKEFIDTNYDLNVLC